MYGWRARIGILIPSANTVMESEFNSMAPEGVSIHAARMTLREARSREEKIQALKEMEKYSEGAARNLASAKPDVIIYGCTSGSFVEGPQWNREITDKLRKAVGILVITTSTTVELAFKQLKLARVAMATPYTEDINEREKAFLETSVPGLAVVNMKGLGIIGADEKGRQPPSTAYRLAREVDKPEADGIFISCTNFRTVEIIDKLEEDLGKPVVTSNQASMWGALKTTGIKKSPRGYGQLLERHL